MNIPKNCSYCLPDCQETSYSSSVTSAPFRRCDYRSFGATTFCQLNDELSPLSFYNLAEQEYQAHGHQGVPEFAEHAFTESNIRRLKNLTTTLFPKVNANYTYDAYEKDMAIAHFFYEKPTVIEFERSPRLTFFDFIAQVEINLIVLSIAYLS